MLSTGQWLLVSELYSIVYPEAKVDLSQEGLENFCKSEMEFRDTTEEKTSLLTGLPNLVAKSDFWNMSWSQVIDLTKKQPKGELHRDTLQVILPVLTHAELTTMWKRVRYAHLSLMFACAQKEMQVLMKPLSNTDLERSLELLDLQTIVIVWDSIQPRSKSFILILIC